MDLNQYWSNYTCQPVVRLNVVEPPAPKRPKSNNCLLVGSVVAILLVAAGAFVFLSLQARRTGGLADELDIGPTNRSEDINTTQLSTESPTQRPTRIPTQPPTRPPTRTPTRPPTKPETKATDPATKVPTKPTEPPTRAPSRQPTEPVTEPATQPPTEPSTDPVTEPPTEPPTEPVTEPPTEPPTEPATEPPTEPPTEPSTGSPTKEPTEEPTDAPSSHAEDATTVVPRPLTAELRRLFNTMEANMNSSINPCEDFYEYACGRFTERHPLPANRREIDQTSIEYGGMLEKITEILDGDSLTTSDLKPLRYMKKFWDSCIAEDFNPDGQLEQLNQYLKELDKVRSPPSKFAHITKDGYNAFFTVEVVPDPRHSTQRILSIAPPKLTFSALHQMKESDELFVHMLEVLRLAKGGVADVENDSKLLKEFSNFEHELAQSFADDSILQNPLKSLSIVTVAELNKISQTAWPALLEDITGTKYDEADEVLIFVPNYFKAFKKTVNGVNSPRTFFPTYFRTLVVAQSCWFLPQCRQSQLDKVFKTYFTDKTDEQIVKQTCLTNVAAQFDDLVIHVYQSQLEKDDESLTNLFASMRKQLMDLVQQFSWMDDATKPAAVELLHGLSNDHFYLSVPQWIAPHFEEKYQTYPFFDSTDEEKITHFDFLQKIVKHRATSQFEMIGQLHPPAYTLSFPLIYPGPRLVADFYSLYLPVHLQRGHFFHSSYPTYAKMGLLGWQLAHEMVHLIDEVGEDYSRRFEPELMEPFSWTELTRERFGDVKECLEKTYSDVKEIKLNGTFTFNENYADIVGVNSAWEAYKRITHLQPEDPLGPLPEQLEKLNYDQMFFLSYANAQCATMNEKIMKIIAPPSTPPRYRVNVVLSQMDQFAEAFDCRSGSKMNPQDKCSVI